MLIFSRDTVNFLEMLLSSCIWAGLWKTSLMLKLRCRSFDFACPLAPAALIGRSMWYHYTRPTTSGANSLRSGKVRGCDKDQSVCIYTKPSEKANQTEVAKAGWRVLLCLLITRRWHICIIVDSREKEREWERARESRSYVSLCLFHQSPRSSHIPTSF